MEGLNLASRVSTKESYRWTSACRVDFDQRLHNNPSRPFHVVAIDFGIKRAILDRLVAHGCEVTVLPVDSDLTTVRSHQPDGVFLSNGPGDPAAVTQGIALAKDLLQEQIFRCLESASGTRFSVGLGGVHLQARLWPSRFEPSLRDHWTGGDHQPKPRVRFGREFPCIRSDRGHPFQSQRSNRCGHRPP